MACDATFGTDPFVMRVDLIESHETRFQQATFRTKHQFADVVHGKMVIRIKAKRQYL